MNEFTRQLDYTIFDNPRDKSLQLRNIISDRPYVRIRADYFLLDKKQLKCLINELEKRLKIMEKI